MLTNQEMELKIKQDNPHLTKEFQFLKQEGKSTFFQTVDSENIPLNIKVTEGQEFHSVYFSDVEVENKFNFVGTLQ